MMFNIDILEPKLYGNIVIVRNSKGNIVQKYSALNLTKSWLTTSNDTFFKVYGFNWIPPQNLQERAKKEIYG